ncbi:accessory factor UbiK family protein [Sphingosinicella sp. CPCC 101087]|uniref:accessory factor UbiK family protein n=1 Tax=Sphingosinicella sp. CPCC 101087 TaxID=2497754 RepID=UPI00101BFFF2|nr:accessory factor UbiK family protein [Sphingosinicella sp. CPCC 101087]
MQSQNRLFDDFVKVMNGAAGTIAGMTREAQAAMQDRARDWIGGLDMVSREEFEAVRALATAAREENQVLRLRIEALEATVGAKAATPVAEASEVGSASEDTRPA